MTESMDNKRDDIIKEAVQKFIEAQLRGEKPDIEEFVRQYPDLKHEIQESIQDAQKINTLFDFLIQADEIDFEDITDEHDLVGKNVGSFEIKETIGRGGMGVVYLAHDTRLKRSVAVKSIPAELQSSSTAHARFRREAELLAALNHPNIGAIHEIIEQEEGANYLILEYVPGQTLAERIDREPLNLEEALSVGQQIAEAVSAAHEKDVIHRDLKPGNIKITPKGTVKVLDFGLAKAKGSQDKNQSTTITQAGRIMGTPAYMSPEQARGKPTDHRTDIWSFGCIMYEMLTGKDPFEGETATDTVARILEREPDWEVLPQETPSNIQILLRRCLEKDQDQRLGDIGDAAIEISEAMSRPATETAAPARSLWRWAMATGLVAGAIVVGLNIGRWREKLLGGSDPSRVKSLAVLPLNNLTGDPNQGYFSDGITEGLITDLGKIKALQVRSRTSTMQFKDAGKPLPEIARKLNVDAVVEGSVTWVGQQVKIEVRLIHALTDTHLWGESYQRELGDVPILLSEVVRTIAREIEITVTPDQEALLVATRSIDPEMYNLYLKGMFHLNKETPEGTKIGLAYLQQAIEKDPEEPLAYGALALGYAVSAHGPGAPPDAFEQAKAAASKALELDDNLAEAHAAMALAKIYRDWDWEGAAKAYRRALQLKSNLNMTRAQYAFYLLLFESAEDALTEMRKVQETDPLTPLWPAYQGWLYIHTEQYDEAIKEARKSLELYSDFPLGLYIQGRAYAGKGMYEQAIKLHQKAVELSPQWKCGLAHTYAMAGRQDEARRILAELEANYTFWDTWFIAIIYVALGEKDDAFRWLEAAYGPPNHPYLPFMRCVPVFKPLHDDPRFADLLHRMNLLQ